MALAWKDPQNITGEFGPKGTFKPMKGPQADLLFFADELSPRP